MSWEIFGHNHIKNILSKQLKSGSLAHAYLFLGPKGLGKKMLALEFAKKILETENLSIHPDFINLECEEGITINQIRNLIANLSFKPFLGKKKVAIIDNVENLNAQGSNALLKTLEEPSSSSVIILVSNQQLLPTVVSRCQVFVFDLFSKKSLQIFAESRKILFTSELADLSFGLPSRFLRLFSDEGFFKQEKDLIVNLASLEKMGIGERILEVSKYATKELMELEKIFLTWVMWKINNLKQNPLNFAIIRHLLESLSKLRNNQNKKLILQGLFLKI